MAHPTDDELGEAWDTMRRQWAYLLHFGGTWRHKKTGHVYVTRELAFRESDMVPLVLYKRKDAWGPTWSRPAAEFAERFEAANPWPSVA
jgi:hypothetical protein